MANRVKQLRQQRKVTLQQLSNKTGISISSLSAYENNRRSPKIENWIKLADFFGVSVSYLQGVSDKKNTSKYESLDKVVYMMKKGEKFKPGDVLKINDLTINVTDSNEEKNKKAFIANTLPNIWNDFDLRGFLSIYVSLKNRKDYKNSFNKLSTVLLSMVLFMTNNADKTKVRNALSDFLITFEDDDKKSSKSL